MSRWVIEPAASIERKALNAVKRHLDGVLRAAAPAVAAGVREVIGKLLVRSDAYQSLLNGDLLGELGIPNVEERLGDVLKAVRDGLVVSVVPPAVASGGVAGGLEAAFLRSDYSDLLGLSSASYVSRPSGSTVPWLEWLLTLGERVVVYGYDVNFDLSQSERARSRTGMALMRPGEGWRVPPRWSGVPGDNWLTKAFNVPACGDLIASVFQREISRRL